MKKKTAAWTSPDHAVYSLVTAAVWYLAVTYAWPSDAEDFAEGRDEDAPHR